MQFEKLIVIASYNLVILLLYGLDKYLAKAKKYRLSEKLLLVSAICFGSYGALLGMVLFHHKIRKPLFYIIIPLLVIIHTLIFLQQY